MKRILLAIACWVAASASAAELGVGGVDHVGLTVTDLAASEAFFTKELGFEVFRRDDAYPAVFLRNGAAIVTLWRATDPAKAVPFDRKQHVGLHHLAFSVESFAALDALHERLKKAPGVRIEFGPELQYGGPAKHMMLYEPSGSRIELIHRPPGAAPAGG
jgi:lactoylglutathione lyase